MSEPLVFYMVVDEKNAHVSDSGWQQPGVYSRRADAVAFMRGSSVALPEDVFRIVKLVEAPE